MSLSKVSELNDWVQPLLYTPQFKNYLHGNIKFDGFRYFSTFFIHAFKLAITIG